MKISIKPIFATALLSFVASSTFAANNFSAAQATTIKVKSKIRDAASGLPTGKRQHKPVNVTKPKSKSTPGSSLGYKAFNPQPEPPAVGNKGKIPKKQQKAKPGSSLGIKGFNPQPEPPATSTPGAMTR